MAYIDGCTFRWKTVSSVILDIDSLFVVIVCFGVIEGDECVFTELCVVEGAFEVGVVKL